MRSVSCRKYRPGTSDDDAGAWHYAHAKRDGHWLTLVKNHLGQVTALTRTPRDITEQISWHPAINGFINLAPSQTTIYCEMFVNGGNREDVKAAMRDQSNKFRVECFAVEQHAGVWVSAMERLDVVRDISRSMGVDFVVYAHRNSIIEYHIAPFTLPARPGTEGWVLKRGNLDGWMKVKPTETYDLKVIGFTEGVGEFKGLIGSLVLADASGNEVARCSGMTLEQRQRVTNDRAAFMGCIVEVAAQGRGSAGGLMHPRFVAVRDDKVEPELLEPVS